MKNITELNKIKSLLARPLFRARDAVKYGVSSSLINYYVNKGIIERIDRGVYRSVNQELDVDFQYEDLVLISKSIPKGVVCLISALILYNLTDEINREHWIAVPNDSRAPRRKGTRIIRMRNMTLGKTKIKVGNEEVIVFDIERTILDSFRYLGVEIGIKALRAALKRNGKDKLDLKKLQNYAKKMRVNIDPYLLAVTT